MTNTAPFRITLSAIEMLLTLGHATNSYTVKA